MMMHQISPKWWRFMSMSMNSGRWKQLSSLSLNSTTLDAGSRSVNKVLGSTR